MKIIATRQNANGLNDFFITDDYQEFSLSQFIEKITSENLVEYEIGTRRNGVKYVRTSRAARKSDLIEDCAITCREEDYLLFDLTWLYLKAGNGHIKKKWRAYSGFKEAKASDQNKKDFGPIPEGSYIVQFDRTLDIESSQNLFDTIRWLIKSPDWGLIVTFLTPDPSNEMYGRDGFSIHGGFFPGSKGCIDILNSNRDFHVTLRLYKRNFKLIVKYP